MIPAEKIIVALDFSERRQVQELLEKLRGIPVWMKVGMELFYSEGPSILQMLKSEGHNVFLDLKLHDIPNTVERALRSLMKYPVDMVNVHAAGGSEMMKRAFSAVKDRQSPPLLTAVTQLTSTTAQSMNREQRIPGDLIESVVHFARLAKEAGCDGVVSSPLEVQAIKLVCGSRFLTVTPGVRPVNSESQDQARVTTPRGALNLGSDYLVIGRPITEAHSPREVLESILEEA